MTNDDYEAYVCAVKYFWEKKEDITCFIGFEEGLPELKSRSPHFYDAWKDLEKAKRRFELEIKDL